MLPSSAFCAVSAPYVGKKFVSIRSLSNKPGFGVQRYVSRTVSLSKRSFRPYMSSSSSQSQPPLDDEDMQAPDALLRRASSVASEFSADVTARPAFYLSGAGYFGAAVLGLLISAAVIRTIDGIPILPSFLKLVGIVYSGYFIYRYLLYDDSRAELQKNFNNFLDKIR